MKLKKFSFSLVAILLLVGYGYFVYAAAPSGGYNPGQILDPDCAPGDVDCVVTLASGGAVSIGDLIGGSVDPNRILYTNGDNELAIDDLFTRNSATKETYIGKDFDVTISRQTITTFNVVGIYNASNAFTTGEQITGGSSGSTGTVEYIIGGFLYLSNVSSGFINGETITGVTSGETAVIGEDFPTTQFSVNDTFVLVNPNTMTETAAGTILSVDGNNQYTVSLFSGTINQQDLIADSLGNNFSKIAAIATFAPTSIEQALSSGGFQVGSLLGGLLQGAGSTYRSQDGSRFALNFVGSGMGGGDTFSVGSIIGDLVANKFSTISQDLYGPTGSPKVQISSSDALNGYNSTILLDRDDLILHNNKRIKLLAEDGIYIGKFDYNFGATDMNPFPLFSDYYILPSVRGSAGQVLTDDGNGNVSWQTPAAGGISLNNTTLYSSGLTSTGNYDGDNIFLGAYAGFQTNASNSNFFGPYAGYYATNASYSNFLGSQAGEGATSASYSNFLGLNAGNSATGAYNSNFLGSSAGNSATGAYNSNFLGSSAGSGATNAYNSNFLGPSAGQSATDASNSNFLGPNAGNGATSASFSNFIGVGAGSGATNASFSNFLGLNAGQYATDASNSNFLGPNAGNGATSASNSIFIGKYAGNNDLVNNTGSPDDFSILIGPNTSTGNNGSGVGYSNSIALGGYATNTASNQFMIGSVTRPITSMVLTGDYSGGSCTFAVGGMSCSSDERLKTNIEDLQSSTLDTVINIRTVHYNWNSSSDGPKQVGFIAQDLQQYFPELVSMGQGGYLQVNYAQMTPILVQAIREMNLNITELSNMERPNTWRDSLIAWFGNIENGITEFIAGTIRAKTQICIDDVCMTKDQLRQVLEQNNIQNTVDLSGDIVQPDENSDTQLTPTDTPVGTSTDVPVDDSTTPTENNTDTTELTSVTSDVSAEQSPE